MLTKIHPSALAAGEGFDAVEVVGVDALVGVDDVELVWDAVRNRIVREEKTAAGERGGFWV